MKLRIPNYYKQFHCLAEECKDNCCIGWEIDIDEDTEEYYRSIPGEFGKTLQDNILKDEEDTFFRMNGKRCAFLNEKNLCDICTELGEEALCEVCLEYPRFTTEYGDTIDKCLALSCEEVGRLIFSKNTPVKFMETFMEQEFGEEKDLLDIVIEEQQMSSDQYPYVEKARDYCFEILQNRNMPIKQRIASVLLCSEKVQEAINRKEYDKIDEILYHGKWNYDIQGATEKEKFEAFKNRMNFYQTLELLDEEWELAYHKMKYTFSEESKYTYAQKKLLEHYSRMEQDYEQLMVYFLNRYVMQCIYDFNYIGKVKLGVVSYLMIRDMDAQRFQESSSFSLEDRIDIARIYSKEVEHSEDNIEALQEAFMLESFFQTELLISLL